MSSNRLTFINAYGNYDVYYTLFPLHLQPHTSPTRLECLQHLEEEVTALLKAIKEKKKEIIEEEQRTTYWVVEAMWNKKYKEWDIRQKELLYVKCSKRYKVYGDWGYKDSFYYRDKPNMEWEIEGRPKVYRKLYTGKQEDKIIIDELNLLK
jgi:hypothetical protein